MSMVALAEPLSEDLGNDLMVQLTDSGGRGGEVRCRFLLWRQDELLFSDIICPDAAADRQRFIQAVVKAGTSAVSDLSALDRCLMRFGEAARRAVVLNRPSASPQENPGGALSAGFAGLVDVVADEDGRTAFLVVDGESDCGLAIYRQYTPTTGKEAGEVLRPPGTDDLPWKLPRASEVLRNAAPGGDNDRELFDEVVGCLKEHAHLPSFPSPHGDAYYGLCAAWVFHTHFLEPASYSPILALYAVPERGKSRLGRTLTYLSRRGIHTETLREANLFRDAEHRGATLFLDCKDLWQKARRNDCEDLLLQRFERSAKVGRVLFPENGPFRDTRYFAVFGPTIIATNRPMDTILETRCLAISMPLAPEGKEYPVPDEGGLLPLRERLTAWRARQLVAGTELGQLPKPAKARLGDVLLPLLQIVNSVAPAQVPSFLALAQHFEDTRSQEREMSWEAEAVRALARLESQARNGTVPLSDICAIANEVRAESEQITPRRLGNVLRSLGLTVRPGHANRAVVVCDGAMIADLKEHYREPNESEA